MGKHKRAENQKGENRNENPVMGKLEMKNQKWENLKMGKWENGKMGYWENGKWENWKW